MLLKYAGATSPKKDGLHNEDCLLVLDLVQQQSQEVIEGMVEVPHEQPLRFAIADGVSGMPSAARASYQLLSELKSLEQQDSSTSPGRMAEKLRDRVVRQAYVDPSLEGAATTLVTAQCHHDHIRLWHAGDSRAYLSTEADLVQLTRDHTMLQYMRETGDLSEEEAERVRDTALFGAVDECFVFAELSDIPSIQTKRLAYVPGEVLLLASDGLHRHLTREEIHACVKPLELAESARNMIDRCLERGGEDDVSLILLTIENGLQR